MGTRRFPSLSLWAPPPSEPAFAAREPKAPHCVRALSYSDTDTDRSHIWEEGTEAREETVYGALKAGEGDTEFDV